MACSRMPPMRSWVASRSMVFRLDPDPPLETRLILPILAFISSICGGRGQRAPQKKKGPTIISQGPRQTKDLRTGLVATLNYALLRQNSLSA